MCWQQSYDDDNELTATMMKTPYNSYIIIQVYYFTIMLLLELIIISILYFFKDFITIFFSQVHTMTMHIKLWQQHCNVCINF
jgi:hypothetical protein